MSENKGKDPLLYINQPDIKKTDLQMQSIYRSDQHFIEEEIPNEKKDVQKTPSTVPKFITKEKSSFGMRRLKSFREMTNEEKLKYLSGFSTNQPLYYCDFLMKSEEIYRGILHQLFDQEFIIKTINDEHITKKIDELKSIHIVQK